MSVLRLQRHDVDHLLGFDQLAGARLWGGRHALRQSTGNDTQYDDEGQYGK